MRGGGLLFLAWLAVMAAGLAVVVAWLAVRALAPLAGL